MAEGTKRNIFERIRAVMLEVKGVSKEEYNQHNKYKYAGYETVNALVRGAFVRHDIVQTINMTECQVLDGGAIQMCVVITWTCADFPESFVSSSVFAVQHSQTSKGGVTAQQIGQGISYAVKNNLFKQLMLTGDDTPDADRHSGEPDDIAPDEAVDAALDYLARFSEVATAEALEALNNEIKHNWGKVKVVKNFSENMVTERRKAAARLRGMK